MCDPLPSHGTRCFTCTTPHYVDLVAAMDEAAATTRHTFANGAGKERHRVRTTFRAHTVTGVETARMVVAEYASVTSRGKSGADLVAVDIDRYERLGDRETANWLTGAVRTGQALAKQRAKDKEAHKKAAASAKRKANKSKYPLQRNKHVMAGKKESLQQVYPGIAAWWDLTHPENKGILPSEVAQSPNADYWLRCPKGHSWKYRGNNGDREIDKYSQQNPSCGQCKGRNPRKFKDLQHKTAPLIDVLGPNANTVFNALAPAIQYEILTALEVNDGSKTGFGVTMAIVSREANLADILTASSELTLLENVDATLDENRALATISDITAKVVEERESPGYVGYTPDEALAAAGVLNLPNLTADLCEAVLAATVEHFWTHAYDTEIRMGDFDAYCEYVATKRTGTPADQAIDRFLDEAEAVKAFEIPKGYQPQRRNKFDEPIVMDPDLSQRRFAVLVDKRRKFMNFSGVGAGKTLATALAVQNLAPSETLVVCPSDLISEWATEFKEGFPGEVEVIRLGALSNLTKPRKGRRPGVNRVWIVNYDRFSVAEPREVAKMLAPLAARVGAIVLDEVHKVKATKEDLKAIKSRTKSRIEGTSRRVSVASKRRESLELFCEAARAANPDVAIVGISATPVVNNLTEAKSLLQLVQGEKAATFATTSTIRNAIAAHRYIAAAGVRRIMTYPTRLITQQVTIDVTSDLSAIAERAAAFSKDKNNTRNTPSYWDRAVLPAKLPVVVEIAKRRKDNNEGGTMVYSYFTEGMIAPIKEALEAAGLTCGTFTGAEDTSVRAENLRKFRAGEIDVIIGSQPIGTGVDGLQAVCNEIVVVSMPWTAADDDQVIGRLFRRGQERNVTVTYLITEGVVGESVWSWCRKRYQRIRFKRDIAAAAVDGAVPEGVLESNEKSAKSTLAHLEEMLAAHNDAKPGEVADVTAPVLALPAVA